jgi:enolase
MRALVSGKPLETKASVKLIGRQYAGTKVMPFKTFGVTAALEIGGKVYLGTGVAPMATSGGVREPQALNNYGSAVKHVAALEHKLNRKGKKLLDPFVVDQIVLELDQELATARKLKNARPTSGIGSEVAIASTVALLDAQSAYFRIPTALAMRAILLHLQGKKPNTDGLVAPLPKFNILNFGRHSGTKRADGLPYIWLQETKVAPIGANDFEEALFMGIEVLKKIIEIAGVDNVGFEAGISPALTKPEEVYELSAQAIEKAGLTGKVVIAADAAASEFSRPEAEGSDKFLYDLNPGEKPLDAEGMVHFWSDMVRRFGILSIEDGMNSEDQVGWHMLMKELGSQVELQGDDLFVTDAEETERLSACANSILIKPNQAGTIVRTIQTIATARKLGYTISPSHRSGKVPGGYGIIPELCLGTEAEWIKPGAPRRERQGFVNNVLTLSDELRMLGIEVGYAGSIVAKRFAS